MLPADIMADIETRVFSTDLSHAIDRNGMCKLCDTCETEHKDDEPCEVAVRNMLIGLAEFILRRNPDGASPEAPAPTAT